MGAAAQKTLRDYMQNPDDLASLSTADLERLTNEERARAASIDLSTAAPESQGKEKGDTQDSATPSAADTGKPAAAKAPQEAALPTEVTAEGVLTKDGKHVIPFEVLEGTRKRQAELEKLATDLQAALEQKNQELARLNAGAAAVATPQNQQPAQGEGVTFLSDEDLVELEQDFPVFARQFRAIQGALGQVTALVNTLSAREQSRDVEVAKTLDEQIRNAIDANAELVKWEATDPDRWARATAVDQFLRSQPKYADVPFADRFAKVVAMVKAEMGDAPSPVSTQTPGATVEEAARARLEKAASASRARVPASLSDLPGGHPPPVDERDRVEQMSAAELGSKFMKMRSPEEIAAYVATLG